MRIIRVGEKYSVAGGEVETYDALPVKTYVVTYCKEEGFALVEHPAIRVQEKVYGVPNQKAEKVMHSFHIFERSLGIILSGDKGIGKTLFAKMVCQKALENGYPVILVDEAYRGIARFLASIDQECVVLFDEFDKTFRHEESKDEQAKLLSLFDGIAGGKKMYIVTCNEIYGLSKYIINRPGRFHYHFRFEYPTPEEIREYLEDKLEKKYYGEIEKVIEFSSRISLNYDCLRAIAFELNQGFEFSQVITELNILNWEPQDYHVYLQYENGEMLQYPYYRANLYRDGGWQMLTFSDKYGKAKVEVSYDRENMFYDAKTQSIIVPGETVIPDYYEEEIESDIKYLKFVKCKEEKLHFVI